MIDEVASYPGVQERWPSTAYLFETLGPVIGDVVDDMDAALAGEDLGPDVLLDGTLVDAAREAVEQLRAQEVGDGEA